MSGFQSFVLDWVAYRGARRRWARAARRASSMPLAQLRRERARARNVMFSLHELVSVADNRLTLPPEGSNAFVKPHGTDWAWRPRLWREPLLRPGVASAGNRTAMGDEVRLFHDCERSEVTLRQLRNCNPADLAPYGVRMDVFAFDGSFLSL